MHFDVISLLPTDEALESAILDLINNDYASKIVVTGEWCVMNIET